MDERIEKILKTDADARKRIAKAQKSSQEVASGTREEIEKLKLQYEKKIETKIDGIRKEHNKTLSALEEKKKKEKADISRKLEDRSKEKFDEWVEEIYSRAISLK